MGGRKGWGRTTPRLIVCAALTWAAAGACRPQARVESARSDARPPVASCKPNTSVPQFTKAAATRILLADFPVRDGEALTSRVIRVAVDEIHRFVQELPDTDARKEEAELQAFDIQRTHCAVSSAEEAQKLAATAQADFVIWSGSSCTLDATIGPKPNQGPSAREGVGEVLEGSSPSPDVLCPVVSLRLAQQKDTRFQNNIAVDLPADMELPAVQTSKPVQLAHFILGIHLFTRRKFEYAAQFLRRAEADVRAGDRNLEALYFYLGRMYFDASEAKQAAEYFQAALKPVQGIGTSFERIVLDNLGAALYAENDYFGAETQFREALSIAKPNRASDPDPVAVEDLNLAAALHQQGKDDEGVDLLTDGIRVCEESQCDSETYVELLSAMGTLYLVHNDIANAVEYLKKSRSKAEEVFGAESLRLLSILNDLGMALKAQNDYAGAMSACQRGVDIGSRAPGPPLQELATVSTCVGELDLAQRRYDEAKDNFDRALKIDQQLFTPPDPQIARDLSMLGALARAKMNLQLSMEYSKQALDMQAKLDPGYRLPMTNLYLQNAATSVAEQGGWLTDGKHGGAVVMRCVEGDCGEFKMGDVVWTWDTTVIHGAPQLERLQSAHPCPRSVTVLREGKKVVLRPRCGLQGVQVFKLDWDAPPTQL
jgi:tetratricopeptide (TPR) repeat protein